MKDTAPTGRYGMYSVITDVYLPFALIFLDALKASNPDHPPLILLHDELSDATKQTLSKYLNVSFKRIDFNRYRGFAKMSHSSAETLHAAFYSRFNLWDPDFDTFDKVLAIDLDTLVVGRLDELWARDEFTIFSDAFYRPNQVFDRENDPALHDHLAKLDLSLDKLLGANAGVFMIPRWRRSREDFQLLVRLAADLSPYLKWVDQSVIVVWLAMRGIRPVPNFKFNYQFQNLFLRLRRWREYFTARVLHFNGEPDAIRLPRMKRIRKFGRVLAGLCFLLVEWPATRLLPAIKRRFFAAGTPNP